MTQGTFAPETEEQRRSASRARRVRVGLAFGSVGLAVAATAAMLLVLAAPEERQPRPRPELDRTAATPPIRLDRLRRSRHAPDGVEERQPGRAEPVIGVGTERFAARRGSSSARGAILDVDGKAGGEINELASDAETRRDVLALERANRRVEAALRGLGGSGRGTGELIWPVRGPITSRFGPRGGGHHAGLDIGVPTGTPVRAADSGRVVISGWMGGYGNFVCLQHTSRLTTCYGHNSRLGIRKGENVRKGGVIAKSGSTGNSTGPHVHFETRVNGRAVDPLRFL